MFTMAYSITRTVPLQICGSLIDSWEVTVESLDNFLGVRFITWTRKSAAPIRCRSRISPPARATLFGGIYQELVPQECIRYADKFDDANCPEKCKRRLR